MLSENRGALDFGVKSRCGCDESRSGGFFLVAQSHDDNCRPT
jgi:hypothetical protein